MLNTTLNPNTNPQISVAIIDVIGLTYDGNTLEHRGLGGSESAVILMSKELVKLGFSVTVFNSCIDKEAKPGIYDGVQFRDLSDLDHANNYAYDVVISSRTVIPFLHPALWGQFPELSPQRFKHIKDHAKLRIVWMHDTFCRGDHLLEDMLTHGDIHEIFTLSDFHTTYATNCDHGRKRMFEVLKRYIFQTRNGIVQHIKDVDITAKDPFLYVYNSSVTKGMLPLVNDVWPQLKAAVPQAKLKVIGGYYRFRENAAPDEQEKTWRELIVDPKYHQLDIEFTGILPQQQIAEILAKSSYMIYPAIFPETFGISTLESLAYNTPLITTRFGALEETAVEQACYLIDYPVEPNGLFPNINREERIQHFVNMAIRASQDQYLHQQKQYYCNIVKDISTWDTVALQWKQHLYKKLGEYLPVDEYRQVVHINHRVQEVFGRRFTNPEERYLPRTDQQPIIVVTPMYNAEQWIEQCIKSVITQDYKNYHMFIIDDASTDSSYDIAAKYVNTGKVTVIRNAKNQGAVHNQIDIIRKECGPEDIVMLLDGDDSLVNDNQIFHFYNNLYHDNTEFSYGSCWSMVDNIPLIAQHYPEQVKQTRLYRQHRFNWNMPYTHLRTFRARLIQKLNDDLFKDEKGQWYKAGGDGSIFYAAIEQADPKQIKVIPDIVYNYNDTSPLNDYKVNGTEQTRNANRILSQTSLTDATVTVNKNLFSVIIPTMWRCADLFKKTLETYLAHPLVGEVLIVNNDVSATPAWELLDHAKIRLLNQPYNIKVNPAWNLAVKAAQYDLLVLGNDDLEFDPKLLDRVHPRITPKVGLHGIIYGDPKLGQPETVNDNIDFAEWKPGDCIHPYGQVMFLHKKNFVPVIDGLNLYYGDDYLFHNQLMQGRKNYMIYNLKFFTPGSQTVCDPKVNEGTENEKAIWEEWFVKNPIPQIQTQITTKTIMTKKKILIAIPTARNIEVKTFKSIYDLEVPEGYETEFQYFYGYQIDQVRNLIAHWAEHYDYLFSVDSDIAFSPDTLTRLLAHNVDVVSGLYIQRKPGEHILEIYRQGRNVPYEQIRGQKLVEIDGCGFGCVLVKSEVFRKVGYPQFVYKSAIDHKDTISEDTYFCLQAKSHGFRIWADTSIMCEHIGSSSFFVDQSVPKLPVANSLTAAEQRLFEIAAEHHIDDRFKAYIRTLDINPAVIYDIGANVLDWAREVKQVWTDSKIVAFEAMDEVKKLFDQRGVDYHLGVLSDQDGKTVKFYQNTMYPWGNSYFKENENYSPPGCEFGEQHSVVKITRSLDSVVKERNFPLPDLIKIDVQGAELDVLKGAQNCLENCTDLFIELQHKEYNKGAPNKDEIINYLRSIGFELQANIFLKECDGDYHFKKKVIPTKVYIIKNNNAISHEYAEVAAESCEAAGYEWENFYGFENTGREEFKKLFPNWTIGENMDPRALCATMSHIMLWKLIVSRKECAIILEHDALMLHHIDVNIPNNRIVALGYKFLDPSVYDHQRAGAPKSVRDIKRHSGAHAYAITAKTAELLLRELDQVGVQRAIDNYYFMRVNEPGDAESCVPLAIADPTPAICWLRKSTIWDNPSTLNYDIIDSFEANSRK